MIVLDPLKEHHAFLPRELGWGRRLGRTVLLRRPPHMQSVVLRRFYNGRVALFEPSKPPLQDLEAVSADGKNPSCLVENQAVVP